MATEDSGRQAQPLAESTIICVRNSSSPTNAKAGATTGENTTTTRLDFTVGNLFSTPGVAGSGKGSSASPETCAYDMNAARNPVCPNVKPIVTHPGDMPVSTGILNDPDELNLLRREKEVLQYELELTKREILSLQQNQSNITYTTSSQSFQNFQYSELTALLPNFDPGERYAMSSEKWTQAVDNIRDIYQLADKMVLLVATSKLQGAAKTWFQGRQYTITSWQLLREGLLKSFPSYVDESDIHVRLLNRRKVASESFEQYFYDMLAIVANTSISERAVIKYIINGVDNKELKRVLSMQRFTKPEELLDHFKWFQEMEEFTTQRSSRQHREVENSSTINSQLMGEQKHSPGSGDRRKCYNCNQHGHFAVDCPQPQRRPRCNNCLKVGHVDDDCPQIR